MSNATRVRGFVRRREAIVPGRAGLQIGPFSTVLHSRRLLLVALSLLVITALIVIAITSGKHVITPERMFAALTGEGTRIENLLLWRGRIPRALLAALVGAALGIAGAITQSITRNPLASPDILGTTAGASMFAVLAIVPLGGIPALSGVAGLTQLGVGAAALLGAALVSALVIATSWRGHLDGIRLVLAGIGFGALSTAAISWVLLYADIDDVELATRWLIGSLGRASFDDVATLGATLLVCALALAFAWRRFSTLQFDADTAQSLGISHRPTLLVALGVAVVLSAIATSVVGPIGFVAFVAPQLALRVFGTAGPMPGTAALTGAVLVLAADRLGALLPVTVPAGLVTTFVGAPLLAYFIVQSARKADV